MLFSLLVIILTYFLLKRGVIGNYMNSSDYESP